MTYIVLVEDASQLGQLVQGVTDVFAVNLCTAAALTWVCHDILITLQQEISTIWQSKWTLTKGAYLFIRYWNVFTLTLYIAADTSTTVSFEFCQAFVWMRGFFGPILSTCVADWLFVVRVNALYSGDRRIVVLTCFLYIATIATGLSLTIAELLKTPVTPRPPGFPVPGCLAMVPPNAGLALIAWVTALTAQCLYFCLTFNKFLGFARQMKFVGEEKDGLRIFNSLRRLAPTMHLFFRDNTFYFAIALILQLLNLIFTVVMKNRALEQMGTAWMMAGFSVVSSRLILNLRDPRNTPGHVTTPWGHHHGSGSGTENRLPIAFAPRHSNFTSTLGSTE